MTASRHRASRLRTIRQGYWIVGEQGAKVFHLLAHTLCRSGVAAACGDVLVDLDGGWRVSEGLHQVDDRSLCAACARFGAWPREKKRRAA